MPTKPSVIIEGCCWKNKLPHFIFKLQVFWNSVNFFYRLPSLLDDLQHHLCWFVAVSFGHRKWLINVYCWWRTLPVSRQDPLGCVRLQSRRRVVGEKKQRLVVVTTERADELNLFELVHSEVVSLYLVAYTCIFPTQRWLKWQIKLYFIWWSRIRRPNIHRSNYTVHERPAGWKL